jgi:transposase
MALHSIARRWAALDTEIRALDRDIKTILDTIAAPLLARHGVGYETAGSLLCAAGDNPDRLATRSQLRGALRHLAGPGVIRAEQPAPPQPRR